MLVVVEVVFKVLLMVELADLVVVVVVVEEMVLDQVVLVLLIQVVAEVDLI
tara:strand:+ start:302 stop:454 length:153 start_codon:yes stop_codon:yes gene_type:complete